MNTQEKNQQDNPYASPQSRIEHKHSPEVYQGKLYQPLSIAIASVFGGFLAAGLLLQSNFKNFAQTRAVVVTVAITIITTTSYLFSSLFVGRIPVLFYLVVNFGIAVVVLPLTMILQGKQLDRHEDAGFPFHSSFRAAITGILCFFAMSLMLGAAFTLFLIFSRG